MSDFNKIVYCIISKSSGLVAVCENKEAAEQMVVFLDNEAEYNCHHYESRFVLTQENTKKYYDSVGK